jgi:putative transposase
MPRALRIEYPGAVYHVMSRGNHGDLIFRDESDREAFLKRLGQASEKTGWLIHAYVLMGNHYHLLLETPRGNLVAGMKWLQGAYTQRFNSRHKLWGHLLQGRYKALNVDGNDKSYFETVATYIHLNPVRARIVLPDHQRLSTFRWSSYPHYLARPAKRPVWLSVEKTLASAGAKRDDASGRRSYEAFMEGRALECGSKRSREPLEQAWRKIRRGWYLGESSFKDRLLDVLGQKKTRPKTSSVGGGAVESEREAAVEAWIVDALKALKLSEEDLSRLAKGADTKLALAWRLRRETTLSREWIAQRLHMGHVTRVTQAWREVEGAKQGALLKLRRQVKSIGIKGEG